MLDAFRQRLAQLIAPQPVGLAEKAVPTLSGFDFVSTGGVAQVQYLTSAAADVSAVDRETAFASALYINAAVQYRARNVSEPPLGVMRRTEEGWEPEPTHPVSELLADPSLDYDTGETLWLTMASLDTYARCVWVKDMDRVGRLATLMPFMGDEARVKVAGERLYGVYEILVGGGRWVERQPEEVVDFRYLSPHSRHAAPSPTDVALSWLNVGEATRSHVRQTMANGMFPSAIISPHHEWHPSADEFAMFEGKLNQYHAGPANAGKPFVMLGGGTVSRAAFNLREMVPSETLARVEANVAAAFGVAPVILGYLVGLENSPWSQMAEARRQTIEDTIVPLWRMIEKALTRQLLRPLDPDPDLAVRFDTSGVVALQADRSKLIADAAAATFWTLDQRLVHSGQEPIGGEAGEWIEAMAPAPSAAVGPEEDKADRDTEYSIWRVMVGRRAATWLRTARKLLADDASAYARATSSAEFRAVWAEATKALDVGSLGSDTLRDALREIAALDAKNSDGLAELLMAATERSVAWVEAFEALAEETAKEAARDAVSRSAAAFDLVDESAVRFARRHAASAVGGITKTTRATLAAVIADAIERGDSLADLAKSITEATGFGPERAKLIAGTEVTAITNGAARQAMSDFQASDPEATVEKSWLSARDDRVRPAHVDLDDGSWQPVDEPFSNGLMEPGEPNCRCTALYRVR